MIFLAAMGAMLEGNLVGSCTSVTAVLGGRWKYTGAMVVFYVNFGVAANVVCQGSRHFTAAAVTHKSECARALGAVSVGVHVPEVLAAMVLHSSLVRSQYLVLWSQVLL